MPRKCKFCNKEIPSNVNYCNRECGRLDRQSKFILKAKENLGEYGKKYNLNQIHFINYLTPIDLICRDHGKFQARADTLTKKGTKFPCSKCRYSNNIEKARLKFLEKAPKVHNQFYSYEHIDYTQASEIVKNIQCPIHGFFDQYAHVHLSGYGCSKCGRKKHAKKITKTREQFVDEAKEIHENLYSYENVHYVGAHTKVEIICHQHGSFLQTPSIHLRGSGCPRCKNSKGELAIIKFLDKHGIQYEFEKRFKGLGKQSFDFFLPEKNTLIEYDGYQHHKPIKAWGGKTRLKRIQELDEKKNKFAKENGYSLIRIPYWDFDNIETILSSLFI